MEAKCDEGNFMPPEDIG